MKALFVNGSPRKNWNTVKLLERAMEGAKDLGAECELVNIYDKPFKGCVSCFACKVKNSKCNGPEVGTHLAFGSSKTEPNMTQE